MAELYHYGTKGQKWGERRYQNKDGTWTELGKERRRNTEASLSNTKLYRVSERSDSKIRAGMYMYTESDKDKYIGEYAHYLKKLGKDVVVRELEVCGNLKVPSHKKSVEIMKKSLDSLEIRNSDKDIDALRKHFDSGDPEEQDSTTQLYNRASKEFENYLKTGKVGNNLYDCLNLDSCFRSSKIMQKIANQFYKDTSKIGYDAIKDMNDSKYGDFESKLPLILTNTSKVKLTSISEITDDDIKKARERLGPEYLKRFEEAEKELDNWIANGMKD